MLTVRMGESEVDAAADTDCHFTGDGTGGGGGMLAGASTFCVAVKMVAGRFGGIRKCSCSSLQRQLVSLKFIVR